MNVIVYVGESVVGKRPCSRRAVTLIALISRVMRVDVLLISNNATFNKKVIPMILARVDAEKFTYPYTRTQTI